MIEEATFSICLANIDNDNTSDSEFTACTSRKTIFYDNFVSFWMHHSKHSRQLGGVIPNIHVTLDHFPITLDISCHFGQCHKRPYFLLVLLLE